MNAVRRLVRAILLAALSAIESQPDEAPPSLPAPPDSAGPLPPPERKPEYAPVNSTQPAAPAKAWTTEGMMASPKPIDWTELEEARFSAYVAKGGPGSTPFSWVAPVTRESFRAVGGEPLKEFDPSEMV